MSILFIDDDPEDTELFCEAVSYLNNTDLLVGAKPAMECLILNTSYKVIDYLSHLDDLPNYIFLDINMPIMGGKDCLIHLKSNPKFSDIPVIMFSTTCRENQVVELKSLGAFDCVQKPGGFNELVKALSKYVL